MRQPIFIGVCGGSGSGKTTIVNRINSEVPEKSISIMEHDAYYKDQSHLTYEQRCKTNYDHPFAFDTDLFVEHIKELKKGSTIQKPIYDYGIHNRTKETIISEPKEIIIVEGLLIFYEERIRELLDIKIFVDTDADIRILRRIVRDMNERKRSLDSVINQYMSTVRPAHEQFIEPSKKYADIIVTEGGNNLVAVDLMVTKIKSLLEHAYRA
ncbi:MULTISPECIES: uridine kinase [Sedimentibacter]|uniref:Uridine kinase n=1 Tax=Sedimentibacter hydroxybenzoicus DSM 7310 TaxID=1123245 RepID=A0A974BLB1_SEDHY|nr:MULTISPECIES: uridine kinase [Sedimentibacter]NYB75319.1 uridine kinase [Sedimentibacter hydroxybenzoicus DSM 7310]